MKWSSVWMIAASWISIWIPVVSTRSAYNWQAVRPILGDVKYGGSRTGEPLCLCSYRLQFTHPVSEEGMDFSIKPRGREFGDFFA